MENQPPDTNITEQFYRETSEHFVSELKKKDREIHFLKQRLEEVNTHKDKLFMLVSKIKTVTKINYDMNTLNFNNYYDIAQELTERSHCINDSTSNVDSDLEDFILNYSELEIDELDND